MREVHTDNVHTRINQLSQFLHIVGLGANGTNNGGLASGLGLNIYIHVGNPLQRMLGGSLRLSTISEHFFLFFEKKKKICQKEKKKKGKKRNNSCFTLRSKNVPPHGFYIVSSKKFPSYHAFTKTFFFQLYFL
jgi:hypothetical protein